MRARLAKWLSSVRAGIELRDVFVFGGLSCVVIGTSQVYVPAAWVVAGGALFWLGVRR